MIKLERIHLMSQTEMLKPLRHFVFELVGQHTDNKKDIDDMVLAVNEACMNVIQHAYQGRDDEEIIVELWKDQNDIVIKICDEAEPVDIPSIKSRDLDEVRPGGLGVHIIHELMDSMEYKNSVDKTGNVLEMRKNIL